MVVAVGCGGTTHAPPPPAPAPVAPAVESSPPLVVVPSVPALPTIPSTPQPAPAGLLVQVEAISADEFLRALVAYIDAARPGYGALLSLQLAAFSTEAQAAGDDMARPMYGVWLAADHTRDSLVLCVPVADGDALTRKADEMGFRVVIHRGWAAIGTTLGLRRAAPYLLTTVAGQRPTSTLHAKLDMDVLRQYLAPRIQAVRQLQDLPMAAPTLDAFEAMLAQFPSIDLTVQLDGDTASMTFTTRPRAGTTAAAFVAAQRPTTFRVLEFLPPGPLVAAGRLDFKPLRESVSALVTALGAAAPIDTPISTELFNRWFELFDGELGVSGTVTGAEPSVALLWETTDRRELERLWQDHLATARSRGDLRPAPRRPLQHRGTRLYISEPATTVPTARPMGVALTAQHQLMAFDRDPARVLRALLDRKPAPPGPGVAATAADARTRGDSYVVAMDVPAVVASVQGASVPRLSTTAWSSIGLAFRDGAIRLHVSVPAAQVGELLP